MRAVGAPAGGVRCAFGEAAAGGAWAGWRGVGASASSSGAAGAGASGVRCVSPASAVTGWVGVQLGGPAGLASSGGSFYYHGSLAVAGLSPPLGPERGGTRVAVAIASPSGGGGGGGGGGSGVGGRDASTVRCRMGNGSGAVLARRVDGAQLECASAARGLGAARVSLSANALAAAAAQYKRPGARPLAEQLVAWRAVRRVDDAMACRREHSILGGAGCCVGPARANRCGAVAPRHGPRSR